MDSLTQFALGAAVAHGVAGRALGRRGLLIGGVLATLPDLDVLISFDDPIEDFTYHRSATHSLPVLMLAAPPLAYLVHRLLAPTSADYPRLLVMVLLVLITHPLLDALTIYGTQLLWPFTEHPFGLGSIFIIDPIYTGILLLALGVVLWRGELAQRTTRIALLLSTTYLGVGAVLQARVSADVSEALAASSAGAASAAVLVHATPFNIFAWRVLVVDDAGYRVGYRSVLAPGQPLRLTRFGERTTLPLAVAASPSVRRLAWFSKGFHHVGRGPSGTWTVTDLRMGVEPDRYVFGFEVGDPAGGALERSRRLAVQRFRPGDLDRIAAMIRRGVPLAAPPDHAAMPRTLPLPGLD